MKNRAIMLSNSRSVCVFNADTIIIVTGQVYNKTVTRGHACERWPRK